MPTRLATLSDEDLDKAISLALSIKRDKCHDSLYEFLKYFWPVVEKEKLIDNWHIKYLCDEIQKAAMRVIRRERKLYDICINVPPGTSKSTIVSVMLPAWGWVQDATLRFITGSFEESLATHLAVKTRDILKSDEFQMLWPEHIEFKRDMDGKTSYFNTKTGGRKVATVGGNITGFHGHINIVDDAINPKGADSETEMPKANRWIDQTLSTRKVDKKVTLTIYIQQRLAEDDTTGHVLEVGGDSVLHICLPAEITDLENVQPPELTKFYTDGLLDPIRMDRAVLDENLRNLGGKGYANQFLQNPSAAEGTIFKRQWWKFYTELSLLKTPMVVQSWDTAWKTKESNDYWCCTTWNVYPHGYYLVDFWMEKCESPDGIQMMKLKHTQFSPHCVLIEEKASGIHAIQQLSRETSINVFPVKVHIDKTARGREVAPTVEAGNVYLPEDADYTAPLIDRLAMFPDGKHDDDADSITQFLKWVRTRQTGGLKKVYSTRVVPDTRF